MPAGQPGSKPAPGCASHDTERPGQLLHHQLNGQRGTRDERVANHLPDLPPLPPLTSPPLPRRVRGAGGGTALTLRGGEQSCHPTALPSWSAARQERGPFTPRTAPLHTTSLVQPHPWHSRIPGAAASPPHQQHPHHPASFCFLQHPAMCENLLQKVSVSHQHWGKKRPQKAQTPKGTFRLAQVSLLCLPCDFYTHLVTRGS